MLGRDGMELIPAVLDDIDALRGRIPCDRDGVADAARVPGAVVSLRLAEFPGVELPYGSLPFALRAGTLARLAPDAILDLTGIRRGSDVHEDVTLVVEGEGLGVVRPLLGELLDELLVSAVGRELSLGQPVTNDGSAVALVEIIVVKTDPGAEMIAELLLHVGPPVAVRVAESDDRRLTPTHRHVHVATVGDGEVAGGAEIVGEHDGAEAVG